MSMTLPSFWHRLDHFLARLRPHREPLSLLIDGAVVAVCWNLTYLFRLGYERWFSARAPYDPVVMLCVVTLYLVAFSVFRVPQGIWRFSGFGEVKRLALACLLAGLGAAAGVMALRLVAIPRAVLALHPIVTLMGVCLVRLGYRMLYEHARERITGGDAEIRRALILGAGEAAKRLLAGIHHQGWIVLGLLDDDPGKQGARMAGVPVLGPLDAVQDRSVLGAATHVVVAIPSATGPQRRRAFELAGRSGLPVLTVPSSDEMRDGRADADRIRDIEPQDLLGREPVLLDEAGISHTLAGKTVLITGAGGSIGSELCRQVARYGPARLVLYELSEFNLYSIEQELEERFPRLPLVKLIGDVKDLPHLRDTHARWRPEIVFHAAAYKHVPLREEGNAWAALRNNTLGTWHAALAAAEHGVERFVLISTDKAVNPTNVMGATKRAAEQIARGGPVTVTHPDIIRYFMTIPEAARLVLQAAAIGESGQVLVLDMGEPVRIVDLARQLIRLAGVDDGRVEIVFSGLRPGEKLYEELLADADATLPTRFDRLRIARLDRDADGIGELLDWCAQPTARATDDEVRDRIAAAVPEYRDAAGAVSQAR
jgi:FlaA1/EpsC-like NDP-sugar epimerase